MPAQVHIRHYSRSFPPSYPFSDVAKCDLQSWCSIHDHLARLCHSLPITHLCVLSPSYLFPQIPSLSYCFSIVPSPSWSSSWHTYGSTGWLLPLPDFYSLPHSFDSFDSFTGPSTPTPPTLTHAQHTNSRLPYPRCWLLNPTILPPTTDLPLRNQTLVPPFPSDSDIHACPSSARVQRHSDPSRGAVNPLIPPRMNTLSITTR